MLRTFRSPLALLDKPINWTLVVVVGAMAPPYLVALILILVRGF